MYKLQVKERPHCVDEASAAAPAAAEVAGWRRTRPPWPALPP